MLDYTPMSLTGFPKHGPIYTNVIPFKYNDGVTVLELLEDLRQYLYKLTDHVDKSFAEIIAAFDQEIADLIEAVNNAIEANNDYVQSKIDEMIAKVNDLLAGFDSEHIRGITVEGNRGGFLDDAQAIEHAISVALSQGIRVVHLTAPVYYLSRAVKLRSVYLVGAGKYATRIVAKAGAGAINGFEIVRYDADAEYVGILNMTIDGGMTNLATIQGMARDSVADNGRTYGDDYIAQGVRIIGNYTDKYKKADGYPTVKGFTAQNVAAIGVKSLPIHITGVEGHVSVLSCNIERCLDTGFTFNRSVTFNSNYVRWSADNGVSLSRGNESVVAVGNNIYGTWFQGIFAADWENDRAAAFVVISGNDIRHVGQYGILIGGGPRNVSITGNVIDDVKHGARETVDDLGCGIFISGFLDAQNNWQYAENITITGNVISNVARYGVNLFRWVRNVVVASNVFNNVGRHLNVSGQVVSEVGGYFNVAVGNPGFYAENGDTIKNVVVANNIMADDRVGDLPGTGLIPVMRYATWHPGIDSWTDTGNQVTGARNEYKEVNRTSTQFTRTLEIGSVGGGEAYLRLNSASNTARGIEWMVNDLRRFQFQAVGATGLEVAFYEDDGVTRVTALNFNRGTNKRIQAKVPFALMETPTVGRPTASAAGPGGMVIDTTLNKVIRSDGTTWKNLDGSAL